MTDLAEHRRGAEQTLGVYCLRASDMVALIDEIERLRAALQDIAEDPFAVDGGAAELARRALEPKSFKE